jgi:hypothetical protein
VGPPLPPLSRWRLGRPTWRAASWLVFLVPLGQIAVLLWVIWTRTGAALYWDEWQTVPLVQHFQQGRLTWQELWAPHDARRILVPRLLDLTLIELSRWNRQIEMTFDLAVGCASAILLLASMVRTVKVSAARFVLVVPLSLLVFSFAEYANWFAPFEIAFIGTVLGVACCMWALSGHSVSWRRFSVVLAGATIALGSSLLGILPWVAFLPSVLKLDRRMIAGWCACGMVEWVAYFIGFPHMTHAVPVLLTLAYILAYLGGPVGFPNTAPALLAGLLSLALFVTLIVVHRRLHGNTRRIDAWIGLALFVLLCSLATALGRLGPPGDALHSRYLAFSGLWWVALFVITAVTVEGLLWARKTGGRTTRRPWSQVTIVGTSMAVMMLASLGLVQANSSGLAMGLAWQDVQRASQQSVVHYTSASDSCLRLYYPWPAILRQRAIYLAQVHLAIFSGSTARTAYAPHECSKPYAKYIDDVGPASLPQSDDVRPSDYAARLERQRTLWTGAHEFT